MDVAAQLNIIGTGGGALTLNGVPSDTAGILAAIATSGLDAADMSMIQDELQGVIDQMKWRHLPFQYIPAGEGLAPTVDFRIPGNHNQNWTIGSKWDRSEPGAR